MKVLLSWLREFVPVEDDPDRLAERMSLSGVTVESVTRTGAGVSGVVVGEVRSIREHPNADALILVRAFDGTAERDIVCGARNFAVGDRVPLAPPGARLPGGLEIETRSVRGETSDGMLCSARELDISDDHSGILVLDQDAPLGKDLVSALDLVDVIFDLDVTANRGDLLSIVGVAREIGALYGLAVTIPVPEPAETDPAASTLATVRIEDARGCPRYVARVIEGVRMGRSPWWLRRRLLACGMRPISNVVDVTNYVLLERGQPLHAFDLDRLQGEQIVVRRPRKGERMTTLDGQERTLQRDDIAICDASRVVAVAGVMGGADTEVSDATTRILLEAAFFDPVRIRRTAGRLGLRTEASARFERGADPEQAPPAAARAAGLLAELAAGRVARGPIDVYPRPVRQKPIRLRARRAGVLIGVQQDTAGMAARLRALGFEVEASRSVVRATPPTWRPDVTQEVDLVEEVARFFGYDQVPERLPPGARTGGLTRRQRQRALARRLLLGAGLDEAQTLSLIPPWLPDRLGLAEDHPLRRAARVSNPLSEDESVLRPSLIPGLLLAAQRNAARRVLPVALFEIGVVFHADDEAPHEHWNAAWLLAGPAPEGWHGSGRTLDFFDAKGVLETLAAGLGAALTTEAAPGRGGMFHPGRSAAVQARGARVGSVAELHPRVAAALELPDRVAVGTLDLDAVLDAVAERRPAAPPRLPAVERDVALIVSDRVPAESVRAAIAEAAGPLLERIELFDVYRGDPVPQGSVSLAFGLAFRDPERTLTDADADGAIAAIGEAARASGWTIRD